MMLNDNAPYITCNIQLRIFIIRLFFCIFIFSSLPNVLWAQDPTKNNDTTTNPVIKFYQTHISGIDGNRCAMYPHCSQYCAQVIRKHGIGLGVIMACDRLLRCGGDEFQLSAHVRINGRELTFDPVSANDFWWFSPKPSAIETSQPGKKLYHSGSGGMSNLNPDQQK